MRGDLTPSWLVVFNAMIITTAMIFGGVALAVHHIWSAAVIVWMLAVPWFFYWASHE